MTGKWQGWLAGAVLAASMWVPGAMAQARSIEVGGREIVIPVEKDYALISDDPAFMAVIGSYLPPSMDLLAVSMHQEDIERDPLEDEQYPQYFYATSGKLRSMDLDDKTWAIVRPIVEAQLRNVDLAASSKTLIEQGNAEVSEQVGQKIEVSADLTGQQQVWVGRDGSLRMTMVIPGALEVEGARIAFLQDSGMAMLPVNGRLLVVYVYRTRGKEEQDSETVRGLVEAAVRSLVDANPQSTHQ